jgi:tripartite-type tricarboxylate transporter receptor subunit TctC
MPFPANGVHQLPPLPCLNGERRYSAFRLRFIVPRRVFEFLFSLALGLSLWYSSASAENPVSSFPNRPVRILVGFPPGGSADIITRIVAEKLSEDWKQAAVVDNRPGASGAIAAELVAKSAKDGYTLGTISASQAILPAIISHLPYDMARDFSPIIRSVDVPYVMVVGNSATAKYVRTIADLVTAARSMPNKLSFASSGTGSSSHLAAEMFASVANIEVLHVPYKGSAPAFTDLVGGRIDYLLASVPEVIGLIRSRILRPIAVTSANRIPLLPDVPSISETIKSFVVVQWFGFVGPASIPRPVLRKLNADFAKVSMGPEVRKKFDDMGIVGTLSSVDEFDALIKAELLRWAEVAKSLGLATKE